MQKRLFSFYALWVLCSGQSAFSAGSSEYEWDAIPKGRPFRLTFADPREIRMGITMEGGSRIQAMVGNYFSLVSLKTPSEQLWHFGIEGAGYFGMHEADGRFPLETTDGLIGIYVEGAKSEWQWQFRYTHISAHLSDGSTDTAIPFSREHLRARMGWVPNSHFQLYGGITYLVNTIPIVDKWAGQLGANYFFPLKIVGLTPFSAFDIQVKQESRYNPSLSAQLGLAINDPAEAYRSFRIFYSYQTGADFRGQFYDRAVTIHAAGIEMQI